MLQNAVVLNSLIALRSLMLPPNSAWALIITDWSADLSMNVLP